MNCEKRKLTLAAQEQGRNSIAISPLKEDLEDLGNYLRSVKYIQSTIFGILSLYKSNRMSVLCVCTEGSPLK